VTTFYGSQGDDYFQLGIIDPKIHKAFALAGNDGLDAGAGNDTLYGNSGNDRLYGSAGKDSLVGGLGRDSLSGGEGNDSLDGGFGRDILYGQSGADSLNGGAGRDYLNGYGRGTEFESDTLTGGTGADTFVLGERFAFYVDLGDEFARIKDFSREEGDKIKVFGSISDYSLELNLFGGTYISYQDDLIAVVENITNLDLSVDFKFV
jgi:Ca2+-binding RTX toxin-like protein